MQTKEYNLCQGDDLEGCESEEDSDAERSYVMLFGHGRQQQIKDNDNDVKITNPWWFFFSFEEIHEHTHELLKKKQSKRLFFERNMTELTKLRIIYLKKQS